MARRNPTYAELAAAIGKNPGGAKIIAPPQPEPTAPTPESVIIILPLPHKSLNPNARAFHMAKADRVAKHRKMAADECAIYLQQRGLQPPRWERATIQRTFYFASVRRRDKSNFDAACKAYDDGLTDAGLWADDSGVTTLPTRFEMDANNPRLVMVITPEKIPGEEPSA